MIHLHCNIEAGTDRISFTWGVHASYEDKYTLQGPCLENFRKLADTARERLRILAGSCLALDNLPPGSPSSVRADTEKQVKSDSYELARAGHRLYQQLFLHDLPDRKERPKADKVLELLRVAGWDEELYIELSIDGTCAVPWNILYDQAPDKQGFDDGKPDVWQPFWGLRYHLGAGPAISPQMRLLPPNLRVLLVVDQAIFQILPPGLQDAFNRFVDSWRHQRPITRWQDLCDAVKKDSFDLIYWLSHAELSSLVLDDTPVTPTMLHELLGQDRYSNRQRFGGILFLNACRTSVGATPGTSFVASLTQAGLSGLVCTEEETVSSFAGWFGLEFLERFLHRGEPLGALLRFLRRHRNAAPPGGWDGVPLGLLYTAYCPPDLHVPLSHQGA